MKGFTIFLHELRNIIRNRKLLISIIGVLFIPVLYSAVYLWAFYDPYAHTDLMPVAVVNLDQGAVKEGKPYRIGDDLVDELKKNHDLKWDFVSYDTAIKGLHNNQYYMMIEIPKDFSEKATTVLGDHPERLDLVYTTNDSYNYLAGIIGKSAVKGVKEKAADAITETYVKTIFDKIATFPEGLKQASDGAHELAVGNNKAKVGAAEIKGNLKRLAESTPTLQKAVDQLSKGSSDLNGGINSLYKGADTLSNGLSQLQLGQIQLVGGAESTKTGMNQLQNGLSESLTGIKQAEQGSDSLAKDLQEYVTSHPEQADDPMLQKLLAESQGLHQGLSRISEAQAKLTQGAEQLSDGQSKLITGMNTLTEKMTDAKRGAVQLTNGSKQLLSGSTKLTNGLEQLKGGTGKLTDGANQLANGAQDLENGLDKLTNGSNQLSDQLRESSNLVHIKGNETMYSMISDPVQLKQEKLHHVPNYATGFAPYFISLGLYVGAMVLTIVYSLRTPAARPRSAFSWFISKFLFIAMVGITQSVIADLILLYVVKIDVQSIPLFFLFSIITSITFFAIIQFLVTALDNPGRFIAILILIIQLTSSAGTYPLEMVPHVLQNIHPFLPMSYSIAGFRAVISSGDYSLMWQNAGILLIFMLIGVMATYLYFKGLFKKTGKDINEVLA